jgi:ATP-dependent Lhr-like helicase
MSGDPHHLIEQAPDGTLMLGGGAEKLVQSRDFFALFSSDVEWRIVVSGKTLGTIPISNAIVEGGLVVFAGRRWKVESVDDTAKVLEVVSHQGGRIPKFDRLAPEDAHDELIAEMRRVYEAEDVPAYLDQIGKELLGEARETYGSHNLRNATSITEDDDVHMFLWRGSSASSVFGVALAKLGFSAENHDFGVTVAKTDRWRVAEALEKLAELSADDLAAMPSAVRNLELEKYDAYIPRAFLETQWKQRHEGELNELRQIARAAMAGMGDVSR